MVTHRREERMHLESALRAEGSSGELVRAVRFGVAYHHAGLASDERVLLENAFRYLIHLKLFFMLQFSLM